jgi:hypothetical protein
MNADDSPGRRSRGAPRIASWRGRRHGVRASYAQFHKGPSFSRLVERRRTRWRSLSRPRRRARSEGRAWQHLRTRRAGGLRAAAARGRSRNRGPGDRRRNPFAQYRGDRSITAPNSWAISRCPASRTTSFSIRSDASPSTTSAARATLSRSASRARALSGSIRRDRGAGGGNVRVGVKPPAPSAVLNPATRSARARGPRPCRARASACRS